MSPKKLTRYTAAAIAALAITTAAPLAAVQISYWPADHDDERLRELDSEILRLQKARFQAIFAEKKNDEEVQRLVQEFRETQKTRAELLRRTGRY